MIIETKEKFNENSALERTYDEVHKKIHYHKVMRDVWQLVAQFLREDMEKKGIKFDDH